MQQQMQKQMQQTHRNLGGYPVQQARQWAVVAASGALGLHSVPRRWLTGPGPSEAGDGGTGAPAGHGATLLSRSAAAGGLAMTTRELAPPGHGERAKGPIFVVGSTCPFGAGIESRKVKSFICDSNY